MSLKNIAFVLIGCGLSFNCMAKDVIIDDTQAKWIGKWILSKRNRPFHGKGYRVVAGQKKGDTVRQGIYRVTVPETGSYSLKICFAPNANRASNTPVRLISGKIFKSYRVNQKKRYKGKFLTLDSNLELKKGDKVVITISNEDADGFVLADAFCLSTNEAEKE